MALRLLVCSALLCLVAANSRVRRIVGGERAQEPPSPSENIPFTTPEPDDSSPLVFVRTNRRRAEVVGNRNPDGTYSFLGIRYALPPTKARRFVRPLRLKPKGLIVANKFGPPCPQWWRGRIVGDEDCLHLNVFTPQLPEGNSTSSLLPVLLWIHGGNFKTGSAAQYVPLKELLRRGVVVVTVQYRLGSLGFLKFGDQNLGGNGGLFDISLGSRWVREYIRFFGGNPSRITIGGQGSGASSVTHLSIHRYFGRNIRGVISMSGGPVSPFALDENPARSGGEVVKANSCTGRGSISTVRCLQSVPFESIIQEDGVIEQATKKGQKNVGKQLTNLFLSGPNVEGADDNRFLPNFIVETPLEAVSHQHIPNIPLLVGVTKQETGGGVKGNLLQDISGLLQSATFLTQGIFKDLLTANTGLYVNNTVNPGLSKLFDSSQYLKFFDTLVGTALSGIDKIIQHSTDALFNLPAFILCNFWGQKNKNVYLYSFEHTPAKSIADYFLNGITLVSNVSSQQGSIKGPSHGDDLAFLFEVRNIDGESLSNVDKVLSEADQKVRDHFVTVVAEFVKTGKPRIDGANDWTPFNTEEGSYMIINDKPKMKKGFRKCTMGLWTGDTDILKSTECALSGASEIVTNTLGSAGTGLLKATNDVTGGLSKAVGGVGSALTGDIIGGLYKQPPPRTSNNKTPSLGLGGLYQEPPKNNKSPTLGGLGSSLFKNPLG